MYKYLTYIINPYTITGDAYFKLGDGKTSCNITLKQLSEESAVIVTYDFRMLVPLFKNRKISLPRNIVDVSQVGRLLIGQSHLEFKGSFPWSIWKLLSPTYKSKKEFYSVKKWFFKGQAELDENELGSLQNKFNDNLAILWEKQLANLKNKGEYDRYFTIEKPINELLLKRQYEGIKVSEKTLLRKLDDIDKAIYYAEKELRSKWNISSIYDKENIAKKLEETGLGYIAKHVNKEIFDDLAEIGAETNDILKQYKILKQSIADKNALLRFGAIGRGRIYPIFDPTGTVTGRILVKTPNIQQLHKTSRDVITSDLGYSLLYPDYSQFEPGILADDSKDLNLISSYNSGDIYNALSTAIFGNADRRKLAKIMFLAFSFGMSRPNLVNLVIDVTRGDCKAIKTSIDSFFGKFTNIESWKNQLQCQLIREGRIGTRKGNYRYRKNKNLKSLKRDEQRWVISQRIQGTASLILKKTILEVSNKLKNAQFLVPMHDAVLYQVPSNEVVRYKNDIESIFINMYQSECPSIKPRITFNKFSGEDSP